MARKKPMGRITQPDPRIGVLCRNGATVFYAFLGAGQYVERGTVGEIELALRSDDRDYPISVVATGLGLEKSTVAVNSWFKWLGAVHLSVDARFDRNMKVTYGITNCRPGHWTESFYLHDIAAVAANLKRLLATQGDLFPEAGPADPSASRGFHTPVSDYTQRSKCN